MLTTAARLSPEAGRQEALNTAQVLTQQQAASGEQNTRTLFTNLYTCVHTAHLPVGSSAAIASSLNTSTLSQLLQHFFQSLSA